MLDHVSLGSNDIAAARRFYLAVLAPLKLRIVEESDTYVDFGIDDVLFSIETPVDGGRATAGNGVHICFRAQSRAEVRAFYDAAIAAGGVDAGPPGLRANYHPNYFGAFVFDLDGNKIEAVCHDPDPDPDPS